MCKIKFVMAQKIYVLSQSRDNGTHKCITISDIFFNMFNIFLVLSSAHGFGRIVGGIETTISKIPYQASLQYHRTTTVSHSCGASIISTKFLLSAAHCAP